MKEIAKLEQAIGADGGKLEAAVGVQGQDLAVKLTATYPLEKIVLPATQAVDSLLTKIEKAIPGDWDKPMIEKAKAEFKEELVKLLAEG